MSKPLILVCLCITGLAVPVQGQETVSNAKRLAPLEWVIGTWKASDSKGKVKKGDKMTKVWRFAWTPNQNALLISQIMTTNGKITGQLDALFGWNRREEAIIGTGVGTGGISGSGWTLKIDKSSFAIVVRDSQWDFRRKEKTLVIEDQNGKTRIYTRVGK